MAIDLDEMNQTVFIDGRMFAAYDAWDEYTKERCLGNPWDIEEEITEKYRHRKETKLGWEIQIDEMSEEDSLRLRLNEEYKKRYIKMRGLFIFYQLKEWMDWDQIQPYIPNWCKELFYPCDLGEGQCSLECQWWPCQNENRKTPEMEEVMKFIS